MARQKEDGSWTAGIRPHKGESLLNRCFVCYQTLNLSLFLQSMCFIGMRGSGKSTGMKHVMYSMRNSFDNGILMSATEEVRFPHNQANPTSFVAFNSVGKCR